MTVAKPDPKRCAVYTRIRDKIAASKQKGMWMGGVVPLGYRAEDRKLLVNPDEAATVRTIFRRYLDLGCVRGLALELDRDGVRTRTRLHQDGRTTGGAAYSRSALYALLGNPVYVGEVRHGKQRYPGQHAAILDRDTWDRVQHSLVKNGPGPAAHPRKVAPSPLVGRLFDHLGDRLTPSHAVKKGRRYRYYVSRSLVIGTADQASEGWRLPARAVEDVVAAALRTILADRPALTAAMRAAGLPPEKLSAVFATGAALRHRLDDEAEAATVITTLVERADLRDDGLSLTVALAALLPAGIVLADPAALTVARSIPMQMKRRGCEMRLVIENATLSTADPFLVKAIARARRWFHDLATGIVPSLSALAEREGIAPRSITQILPFAFLAPDIVEAVLAGTQPAGLTTHTLMKHTDLPADWAEQRRLLGFG